MDLQGIISRFVFLLVLLQPISGFANSSLNDSIVYVWDFSVEDPKDRDLAAQLTEDFETELIKYEYYKVLERRQYNRIAMHRNMEDNIAAIESLSQEAKDKLIEERADMVIFGILKDDIESGQYEVTVSFQRLSDASIPKKESILISRGMIRDNQSRKDYMSELMDRLHAKELMVVKKEYYTQVSGMLTTYLRQIKDLRMTFHDVAEMAFDNPKYFDELNMQISDYNDIFKELDGFGESDIDAFSKSWDQKTGDELRQIRTDLLDDIHKPYVLKLNEYRIEMWEFSKNPPKKKYRDEQEAKIIANVRNVTDEIQRRINIIEPVIVSFDNKLSKEINNH